MFGIDVVGAAAESMLRVHQVAQTVADDLRQHTHESRTALYTKCTCSLSIWRTSEVMIYTDWFQALRCAQWV